MSKISEMRDKLSSYIHQENISQSQISKELDVSKTTLSLFLKGVYTGDNEEIGSRIEQYFAIGSARRVLAKSPDFCPTITNTQKILESVKITHVMNDILLLYGAAGCGKTTALKYYSQNNNGVVFVEADVTTNSPRSILMLIMEAIGERPRGATADMMRLLTAKLQDTNKLIIIDEAQHLTPKSFDELRALNDKAGVGIVYSGNPSILKRMYGRMEEDFDQVYSRIGFHCEVSNRHSFSDIQQYFRKYPLPEDCLKFLHKIAHRKGGLRLMDKQYKLAANIATALQEDLAVYHFEEAAKRMGIGGLPI